MSVRYLVDTSAAVRMFRRQGMEQWGGPQRSGLIGLCDLTELEILYSTRSSADRSRTHELLAAMFPRVPIPDRAMTRAHEVQAALTERGEHRSAGPVDLVMAATAELSDLAILHEDRDFETVSSVTGQETRRLLPPSG